LGRYGLSWDDLGVNELAGRGPSGRPAESRWPI